MGNKALKTICSFAEDLGLEVVDVDRTARHHLLRLKNSAGVICTRTISGGAHIAPADEKNTKAELRRFARCQYHGLRITHTPD